MDRYYVWEIVSYSWTEIGIEDAQCEDLVRKAGISVADLREVDRIIFRDVCASFAVDSFLVLPCMLWMFMPDWGYEESYLRKRMERWYSTPYWRHLMNPFRWLGYPGALLFAARYRSMLLPPAYLVREGTPSWREALQSYVYEMRQWVSAVRNGEPLTDIIPVNVEPTPAWADELDSRLSFINERILDPSAGEVDGDS